MSGAVAIVQARMGSSRLPGKVLAPIGGMSMLARVARRASRARLLQGLVVATTTSAPDDAIVKECVRLEIPFYRGKEDDVLDRYYQTALFYGIDVIVRITADCPLTDPEVIDSVVGEFIVKKPDYASNVMERRYPRGLDVEVMSMKALTCAWQQADLPYQRIHVTPFIYQNPDQFYLLSVKGEEDYSAYRWTVDAPQDLAFINLVYERFNQADHMGWREVVGLMKKEPGIMRINQDVKQKELSEG